MKIIKYIMLTALAIGGLGIAGCEKGGDDGGNGGGNNGGDPPKDNRAQVTGTYHVHITHPLTFAEPFTDIEIALDGRNNLIGSGSASMGILGDMELEIPLTNLKEFTRIDEKTVTGYYFKVAENTYRVAALTLVLAGSGQYEYDGVAYDGYLWKNATESYIVGHIASDGGTGPTWVKLESGTEPAR